uniref:Uncharacterized protein n=1 Tax=Pyxicephalus adspersus TaxID=30357 RepID=A0AAV2ZWD9_PYXAD|nr:TPA: hypothetical protein GDO54_016814 [Pyxicephalus adspersus]
MILKIYTTYSNLRVFTFLATCECREWELILPASFSLHLFFSPKPAQPGSSRAGLYHPLDPTLFFFGQMLEMAEQDSAMLFPPLKQS